MLQFQNFCNSDKMAGNGDKFVPVKYKDKSEDEKDSASMKPLTFIKKDNQPGDFFHHTIYTDKENFEKIQQKLTFL